MELNARWVIKTKKTPNRHDLVLFVCNELNETTIRISELLFKALNDDIVIFSVRTSFWKMHSPTPHSMMSRWCHTQKRGNPSWFGLTQVILYFALHNVVQHIPRNFWNNSIKQNTLQSEITCWLNNCTLTLKTRKLVTSAFVIDWP